MHDDHGESSTALVFCERKRHFVLFCRERPDRMIACRRPHMVVVLSSVLDNWDSELKKLCPSLNTVKYHASQKERAKMRQSLDAVSSGAAREDMPVRDFGTSNWGRSTSDRCQKQSKRFLV